MKSSVPVIKPEGDVSRIHWPFLTISPSPPSPPPPHTHKPSPSAIIIKKTKKTPMKTQILHTNWPYRASGRSGPRGGSGGFDTARKLSRVSQSVSVAYRTQQHCTYTKNDPSGLKFAGRLPKRNLQRDQLLHGTHEAGSHCHVLQPKHSGHVLAALVQEG